MANYDIFVLDARPSDTALITSWLKSKGFEYSMHPSAPPVDSDSAWNELTRKLKDCGSVGCLKGECKNCSENSYISSPAGSDVVSTERLVAEPVDSGFSLSLFPASEQKNPLAERSHDVVKCYAFPCQSGYCEMLDLPCSKKGGAK